VVRAFGTIDKRSWPGVARLPDYGKLCFAPCAPTPLAAMLPAASAGALHLLGKLLCLVPGGLRLAGNSCSAL
jgi:hypothetical protein